MKMGIKSRDECLFCDSKPETIEDLFWYCDQMFPLWSALTNWIREVTKIEVDLFLESVLLGYTNCQPCKNAINCIILVVKFFICKCKMEGHIPDYAGVQSYLKFHYNIENLHVIFPIR